MYTGPREVTSIPVNPKKLEWITRTGYKALTIKFSKSEPCCFIYVSHELREADYNFISGFLKERPPEICETMCGGE